MRAFLPRLLPWGRWLVLPLLAALLVRPPAILVTPGPPQQVLTNNPKVGVHTRLSDEVEAWKIKRTLVMVREMGASWIVEYFPWAYIEPEEGRYDWAHSDLVMTHAQAQGLRVIARLGMVPQWARLGEEPGEPETTFTYLDRDHYADFARFVAAFAARYAGTADHLIIWNEPNLSFEWGYRPVDPAAYADLLRTVYPLAHAANPNVVILGGALAPTLEPEGSINGLNDLLYLERFYEAGGGEAMDALAAHAYGLVFPPEMDPAPDLLNFRRVELLHEMMARYGDGDKPIYVTESGWNDHPRWAWAVHPSQRIRYTLDSYAWAAAHWPWCPMVATWVFRTPKPLHSYQDGFSFVTPDFRPRPIYYAVREALTGQGFTPEGGFP